MKSVEPSIGTSKRSRGEASTTTLASDAIPTAEEAYVDPTVVVDPFGGDDVDPTITLPFSLRAMMESFMTTQAVHRQLLDKLLTEVVALLADFVKCRSVFPPSPFDD